MIMTGYIGIIHLNAGDIPSIPIVRYISERNIQYVSELNNTVAFTSFLFSCIIGLAYTYYL